MPDRILRPDEVEQKTGLRKAVRYKLEALGQFPRAIRISERLTGYSEAEVQAWIDKKISDENRRIETLIVPSNTGSSFKRIG